MPKLFGRKKEKRSTVAFLTTQDAYDMLCATGYTPLDRNPEVMTACRKIAEMIATCTIRLMSNTEDGDQRIINELSRKIDIDPMPTMTRQTWMEGIVMNMLLYGRGNAIVVPHTWKGTIQSLEPISAGRVDFQAIGYRDYKILIDGVAKDPKDVLHFVYNPDQTYLWKGKGMTVSLEALAKSLKQAEVTKNAFLSSEYKPSIIVKVDALADEFASPEGRQKLLDSYVKPARDGEPWLIPAEAFDVQQVKPLTLADLAISDTVLMDKKMVAAILGVPPYIVGAGDYNKEAYNDFIQGKIMTLAKGIAAELTRKILISPSWYWELNVWSLMDYDLQTMSNVLLAGSDRGYVNGDEWRDRMHMNPAGLKEYKILENYLPYDMSGKQKKLIQEDE